MSYVPDPRVDAYVDRLPGWQQAICREVRALVHAADPEVGETIKRSVQPYFVLDGNICALLAGRGPSSRAPYLAGSVASACALLLLASSPLAFARSGCGCSTPVVPYVPPTLAGMDATTWAMISAVGTPVFLLVALMGRSWLQATVGDPDRT